MTFLQRLFGTDASTSARNLAKRKHEQSRWLVRFRVDQMRADMGMTPVRWPRT